MNISGSVIVSFDFRGKDEGVLIVGKQKGLGGIDILNAFEGKDAMGLYKKLVTVEKNDSDPDMTLAI